MLLFKIKSRISLGILFFLPALLFSQVEISNKIILTGDTIAKRQFSNLSPVVDSTQIVGANEIISGRINFYNVDSFFIDKVRLSGILNINNYINGLQVNYIAPDSNVSGNYLVKIGELPYLPVLNTELLPIAPGQISKSNIVCLEYNGSAFLLRNPVQHKCPIGYAKMNEQYCIEINEHPAVLFWPAITTCYNSNAKICTWGEWYYACQKTSSGLTNMTNNYEWVNSASNNPGQVVTPGLGGCTTTVLTNASSIARSFRCCYSLKD